MANHTESAAEAIGVTVEAQLAEDELKLADDFARTLPSLAVKDLLSIGVCIPCIFRLLGGSKYTSCIWLPTTILSAALRRSKVLDDGLVNNALKTNEDTSSQILSAEPELDSEVCGICLGILQFSYCDDKGMPIKRDGAREFAGLIAEMVKQDGHQIDNFSLEVSVPARITENEQAVWMYMKNKYVSEPWFQEKLPPGNISAKDAFKMAITRPLESSMHVDCVQSSSFRIRLTYTHFEETVEVHDLTGTKESNKRRKIEQSESIAGKEGTRRSSNGPNHNFANNNQFQLEKVSQPCRLTLLCNRTPLYIGGRYLKYSRNVSQSRWIVDDERVGEASVEEIIGSSILPLCKGDNYKFHAAGREDIDVRMLGTGRPFLVEIQNARNIPSGIAIKEIEGKINSLDSKLVGVKNVKVLGSQGWSLMREGEAEKQKQYVALVWISRSLEDNDMEALSSSKDMTILQRTPIRVLHRRSPLEREKIIHWMKIERIAESSQYFLLHLCTQAGTYIKEFVHGDLGRTHPSIGSILGCRAEIVQLDVIDVKMDCFLDSCD